MPASTATMSLPELSEAEIVQSLLDLARILQGPEPWSSSIGSGLAQLAPHQKYEFLLLTQQPGACWGFRNMPTKTPIPEAKGTWYRNQVRVPLADRPPFNFNIDTPEPL